MSDNWEKVVNKITVLEREIARLRLIERGRFVPLTTPLTSTAWDGDAYSTTGKTKIDLSSVFSAPAGISAVLVYLIARDSGSAGSNTVYFGVSPNDTDGDITVRARPAGKANDALADANGICPCNVDGDIYYQIIASGSGTMDCWLRIYGYYV